MLIVMRAQASSEQLEAVLAQARSLGHTPYTLPHAQGRAVAVVGTKPFSSAPVFEALQGVAEARQIRAPYPLLSREVQPTPSVVQVGDVAIGGKDIVLMAGPCAVETRAQLMACAKAAQQAGARLLRGGAFKPRTSPHAFAGLGEEGLALLAEAAQTYGLQVVTEVMDARDVPLVARYADMLQIGARNMQNYTLLRAVGECAHPVLLKRGLSATYQEWLLAAEHIRARGNGRIVLCERGIRTFETATRNTLDIAAVPVLRSMTHLPIIIDPSHGTGRRDAVVPMARAAIAAGADGLMVECHPDPDNAWSDGPQSLTFAGLGQLAHDVGLIAAAVGRRYAVDPHSESAHVRA